MTLSEMIEATVKDADQYGAFMEFDHNAGKIGVRLDAKQSRSATNSSRRDHFSKNFTLDGKRISRANLEKAVEEAKPTPAESFVSVDEMLRATTEDAKNSDHPVAERFFDSPIGRVGVSVNLIRGKGVRRFRLKGKTIAKGKLEKAMMDAERV